MIQTFTQGLAWLVEKANTHFLFIVILALGLSHCIILINRPIQSLEPFMFGCYNLDFTTLKHFFGIGSNNSCSTDHSPFYFIFLKVANNFIYPTITVVRSYSVVFYSLFLTTLYLTLRNLRVGKLITFTLLIFVTMNPFLASKATSVDMYIIYLLSLTVSTFFLTSNRINEISREKYALYSLLIGTGFYFLANFYLCILLFLLTLKYKTKILHHFKPILIIELIILCTKLPVIFKLRAFYARKDWTVYTFENSFLDIIYVTTGIRQLFSNHEIFFKLLFIFLFIVFATNFTMRHLKSFFSQYIGLSLFSSLVAYFSLRFIFDMEEIYARYFLFFIPGSIICIGFYIKESKASLKLLPLTLFFLIVFSMQSEHMSFNYPKLKNRDARKLENFYSSTKQRFPEGTVFYSDFLFKSYIQPTAELLNDKSYFRYLPLYQLKGKELPENKYIIIASASENISSFKRENKIILERYSIVSFENISVSDTVKYWPMSYTFFKMERK